VCRSLCGESGRRNNQLAVQLGLWARHQDGWCVFDSSTGFLLPAGTVLSPDASTVRLEGLAVLDGEPELTGLRLALAELWDD
jgi:Uma2 family endonuclease